MIAITTHAISGKEITSYLGIVASEVIQGADVFADVKAAARDAFGGRSKAYEDIIRKGRDQALAEITQQAEDRGANAIVAVRFDYEILGAQNGMLMVAASGTAVVVGKTAAEKAADERHVRDDVAEFFVTFQGAEKGPFSVNQLSDLVERGVLDGEAPMRSELRAELRCVSDVVASTGARI